MSTTFTCDATLAGELSLGSGAVTDAHIATDGAINIRTKAKQNVLDPIKVVHVSDLRRWDALNAGLPITDDGSDDLWIEDGTWGTDWPLVKSDDVGNTTATQYASFPFFLPGNYQSGETITVRVTAKMGVVADDAATLDLTAYRSDGDGTVTAVRTTAAVDVNNATYANYDYTITPTSRVAGDEIWCQLAFIGTDAATGVGSGVVLNIAKIQVLADTRG